MSKFCACGREGCPICKGKGLPITESSVSVLYQWVEEEGQVIVTHIICSCGCRKMVKVGPVYASSACRSRAWRKKKAE